MECEEVLANLVTNRGSGAYYNVSDINRVGQAINCLAASMREMGYPVADDMPTDWAMSDIYYDTDGDKLISRLETMKNQLSSGRTGTIPAGMDGLSYTDANDIEKFLLVVDEILAQMKAAYLQCGVEQAGGARI